MQSGAEVVVIDLATSRDGDRRYVVFERSREVQNLSLRGLGYFKRTLGMDDYVGSFGSWIERRGPVLIGCLSEAQLLGWCMLEPWERNDRDRTPIFLLRTIEVGAQQRGQGMGRHLMNLVFRLAPGHMITHPLNAAAQRFFEHLGFLEAPEVFRDEMRDRYGYLLLPSSAKQELILEPPEDLVLHTADVQRFADTLRAEVLHKELVGAKSFAQAFAAALPGGTTGALATEIRHPIRSVTSQVPCACGSIDIEFFTTSNGREYLSAQCERCGRTWMTIPL